MSRKRVAVRKRRKRRRRAVLLAGQDGRIRYADPPAQRWLKDFFGRPTKARTLPTKVQRWLSQRGQHRRFLALTGQRGQQHLHIRCQNSLSDESTVLLLELIRSKSEERQRRHRQLTRREREVLFWVSQSKTNQEVASILGIATTTVGKHLERIYPKLGVENRAGATAYAAENPTVVS